VEYATTVRSDLGNVASGATDVAALQLDHANIHGFLSTAGAVPQVSSDGLIGPFGTAPGVIDTSRVATDFNATFPVIAAPVDGTLVSPLGDTLGVAGQTTRWRTPFIKLSGKQTLTILGHVTLVITAMPGTSAIDITGSASIVIAADSSLAIYVEGDVQIAGNGVANANIQPVSFQLWGTNTTEVGQSIQITGNGSLHAIVYAPQGDVTLNGNGDFLGSIVARDITLSGNAVDNAPFGPEAWRLITSATERKAKGVLFEGW